MRPQLLAGGLIVPQHGTTFCLLPLLLADALSIPLALGGGPACPASFFVSRSPGLVELSEESRFCAICSTQVPNTSERCLHGNGLRPSVGA